MLTFLHNFNIFIHLKTFKIESSRCHLPQYENKETFSGKATYLKQKQNKLYYFNRDI